MLEQAAWCCCCPQTRHQWGATNPDPSPQPDTLQTAESLNLGSDLLLLFPADEAVIARNVLEQLKRQANLNAVGYAQSARSGASGAGRSNRYRITCLDLKF